MRNETFRAGAYASIPAGLAPKSVTVSSAERISIVVPALDDEEAVAHHLPPLVATGAEVIVADGGSRDQTATRAETLGGRVVPSAPGRGVQLNAGAAEAKAEILLFVHADTRLPTEALERVCQAIDDGAIGGGFKVRFATDRGVLKFGAWLINRRTAITRVPLGDQAQFATRAAFDALGGFEDWPILEDLSFGRRLKRHGRTSLIDIPVTTSPRRFERKGVLRTIATNWLIWALFFAGASPHRLARLYRQVR